MTENSSNPERRIILQGTPTEEQLRNLSEFAVDMGLRMVTFLKVEPMIQDSVDQPNDTSEIHVDDNTDVVADTVIDTPDEQPTNELESIRKKGSKFSFQRFGFDFIVDKDADKFTQRAQRGAVTGVWSTLAKSRYADMTRGVVESSLKQDGRHLPTPFDPRPLLGVDLPNFGYVPKLTDKIKYYGNQDAVERLKEGVKFEYIDTENCDDIDVDGLALYLIAVAERANQIPDIATFNSRRAMASLKQFIPMGIGMPSLLLLTEYCNHMLENDTDSIVDKLALTDAVVTFSRLSEI